MADKTANLRVATAGRAKSLFSRALRSVRIVGGSGLSLESLDVVIRTLAMVVIVALSFVRFLWPTDQTHDWNEAATYLAVAAALVAYNLTVVALIGVPWRRKPGEGLFAFDGLVALVAILLTGGIFSPFIVLTYALVIGATLRLPSYKPFYALAGCIAILVLAALALPASPGAPKGTVLVVEITSLVMVAITALSLRRTLEIEADRLALEEAQALRLSVLNELTAKIVSGALDPAAVLKTVACTTATVSHSQRSLAVLLSDTEELVRASTDPDPVVLTARERSMVFDSLAHGRPRQTRDDPAHGHEATFALCIPLQADREERGALLLWRTGQGRFGETEVSLLSAMAQQMAVGVRLARLYGIERERALRSEERERLERDLLSLVSHDLRTPLTAIRTSAGALSLMVGKEGERQPEAFVKLANNIDRNAERLSSMVDDLLDMARLRGGRLHLDLHPANLGEIICDLASNVIPHLAQKEQRLALDLPSRESARWQKLTCLVDRRRMEQVILNLFTNAQRFAPPASTITIGATERNGEIRLFVRDTGQGIPVAEQERIFDRFYSGDNATARHGASSSLGLGLAIARSIVEMHGGKIWVQSRPGAGSTFFVSLKKCE